MGEILNFLGKPDLFRINWYKNCITPRKLELYHKIRDYLRWRGIYIDLMFKNDIVCRKSPVSRKFLDLNSFFNIIIK